MLLQQMMQQNQRPMPRSWLEPIAQTLQAALMAKTYKKSQGEDEAKAQAQVKSIADVLAPTAPLSVYKPGPGEVGIAPPTPSGAPTGPGVSSVQGGFQQNKSLRDVLGGDPELGKAMLLKKWEASLGGQDGPKYKYFSLPDEEGRTVQYRQNEATGETEVVKQGGKKPPAVSTSTTVNVGENAFEKGVGTKAADAFATEYDSARSAMENLPSFTRASQLLGDGTVIAGTGANALLAAKRLGATLGFTGGEDVASTEEYLGLTGKFVAQQIKAFGAGTGLSDADREFARQIAGGDIGVTPEGLKRLIKMGEKAARGSVSYYNTRRSDLGKNSQLLLES
jgi:hypothetical protein